MVCCIFLQSWYWQWSSSQFSLCTSSWSEDPSSQESTVFSNKILWFLEFTLVGKKMWTGKSRCVCWCWFCLTYFYPRRYLTQWKLLRDCDQDPHGTPEDTTTVRRHEHRQEHENKWSYQHLSGRKHVPYREERQDRQAFRVTHTHTLLSPATLRQLWHQRVLVSDVQYTNIPLTILYFHDLTLWAFIEHCNALLSTDNIYSAERH